MSSTPNELLADFRDYYTNSTLEPRNREMMQNLAVECAKGNLPDAFKGDHCIMCGHRHHEGTLCQDKQSVEKDQRIEALEAQHVEEFRHVNELVAAEEALKADVATLTAENKAALTLAAEETKECVKAEQERDEALACTTKYGDAGALQAVKDANDQRDEAREALALTETFKADAIQIIDEMQSRLGRLHSCVDRHAYAAMMAHEATGEGRNLWTGNPDSDTPVGKEPIDKLRDAVEDLERDHPLPRCKHGAALRDHGGEMLEPTCGCRYDDAQMERIADADDEEDAKLAAELERLRRIETAAIELNDKIEAIERSLDKPGDLTPVVVELIRRMKSGKGDLAALAQPTGEQKCPACGYLVSDQWAHGTANYRRSPLCIGKPTGEQPCPSCKGTGKRDFGEYDYGSDEACALCKGTGKPTGEQQGETS